MTTRPDFVPTGTVVPRGSVGGRRRLVWLSLFGGACIAAGGVPLMTGAGLPCPFLTLTGWLCPLCGASRMGTALIQGHLGVAWGWNPFVLVLGFLLAIVWLWTAVGLATGRSPRLPGPLAALDGWSPTRVVLTLVAPGLVFMVLRNVL